MTTKKDRGHRGWSFTVNNYKPNDIVKLKVLPVQYMLFGYEEAPTTGTPHLQGVLHLYNVKTQEALIKFMGLEAYPHVEPTRSFQHSSAYCKKIPGFFEFGRPPMDQAHRGEVGREMEQKRWQGILECALEGDMESIEAKIRITQCRNLDYIRNQKLVKAKLVDTPYKMLWFCGGSGTGKSRKARGDFPDAYLKMCNKWWDGYEGQDTVIIEDFDEVHKVLIHHMKLWLDRYPFLGEKKGTALKIRPRIIVVTSNYHPEQIWHSKSDLDPILRRCSVYNFDEGVPFVDFGANFRVKPEEWCEALNTPATELMTSPASENQDGGSPFSWNADDQEMLESLELLGNDQELLGDHQMKDLWKEMFDDEEEEYTF